MRLGLLLVLTLCSSTLLAQRPSGISWNDKQYLALPLKADFGDAKAKLPVRYSLKPYCPRVVNQKSFATSAGWATAWYGQTIAEAVSCIEGDQDKITANAFSPLYPYRLANSKSNCTTPVSLVNVFELLHEYGTPRFSDFNDLCPIRIPAKTDQLAVQNKLDGFAKLFNPFDTQPLKINAIKKALSGNHPVIIGMITPPSFALADAFWQPREEADSSLAAQALCIVGYDDQKFGGAVEVVNQWGTSWGEDGFTWIRYVDLYQFARYGFELFYSASCFPLPEASVILFGDKGNVIEQVSINNKNQKLKEALKIGTKFRVAIRTQQGVFVYFLIQEATDKVVTLFPTSTVHPYVMQSITLPSTEVYYQLEGAPQVTDLYLVISKQQLSLLDLQALIENGTLVTVDNSDESLLKVNPLLKEIIRVAKIQIEQY